MTTTARQDLERELRDPEFKKYYGAAEARSELALALANARQSLGITQEELSRRSGVSQPYVAKLESGEANPTIGAIGSLLAILNLRLDMAIAPLLPEPNTEKDEDRVTSSVSEYTLPERAGALTVKETTGTSALVAGKPRKPRKVP